jgi:Domain of unknown function (DUF5916)/Carbohydrate family 9 binding domain-like
MRSSTLPPLALLLALLAPAAARAQASAPAQPAAAAAPATKTVAVTRYTGEAPKLDGVLDDAAWAQARVLATDFVQRAPNPGSPATLPTEARILIDGEALWVAMRMHDPSPDSIVAPVARRDLSGVSSEWAHVFVGSYADQRTAFRFSVNAAGVQKDVFHSNDYDEDIGWDAVWQSAARVDSAGWTAELRIPLSQLRFSAGVESWGLQLTREIARRNEIVDWSPVRPERSGFISQAGLLTGLTGLRPVRRLEVLPYTVARVTREPEPQGSNGTGPFWRENETFGTVGADLKYGLTSNLTLTATLNPDFGQVEADPSQVNLTAFETFFQEKRPFFTEGSDIFRFNVSFPYGVRGGSFGNDQPFYSRRLGRQPQGGYPDNLFADAPQNTTILGAAKLSGKTASGWSVGVLDALTAEESLNYLDPDSARRTAVVEPMSNYFVARAIKDFRAGNSAVGGIFTATHRDVDQDDPRLSWMTDQSYMAGLDGRHRFGGGNFELTGAVAASHVRGSEDAIVGIQLRPGHLFQRPDASHLSVDADATSLTGWLADVKVEKTGGGHLRGGLYAHARSPGLEMNDLGFQRTTDWLLQGMWIGYNQFNPQGPFRRWNANVNAWNGYNFGGEHLATGVNFNGSFNLKNNWGGYGGFDHEFEALRADFLRGGPAIVGPSYTAWWSGVFTDGRRLISGELSAGGFQEWGTAGREIWVNPFVSYRPSGRLRLSVGTNFSKRQDPWTFVSNPVDSTQTQRFVIANIDQTTVGLTTRLNYAFTPNLTLEFYAQPFVSAGDYSDYREVTEPQADEFDDRFRRFGTGELIDQGNGFFGVDRDGNGVQEYDFRDRDFNFKELRSNLVVRWEYRPGSTVFLVWSQGRQNFENPGDFRLNRDFRRLFDGGRSPSTNVLLLKVNWWLDL